MCYSIWHIRWHTIRFPTETNRPFVRRKTKLGQTNCNPRHYAVRHEAVRGIPERTGKKRMDAARSRAGEHFMYGKGRGGQVLRCSSARHTLAHITSGTAKECGFRAHTDCSYRVFIQWKTLPSVLRFPVASFPPFLLKTLLARDLLMPGGCVSPCPHRTDPGVLRRPSFPPSPLRRTTTEC